MDGEVEIEEPELLTPSLSYPHVNIRQAAPQAIEQLLRSSLTPAVLDRDGVHGRRVLGDELKELIVELG